jgi:hypothetical protein
MRVKKLPIRANNSTCQTAESHIYLYRTGCMNRCVLYYDQYISLRKLAKLVVHVLSNRDIDKIWKLLN